MRGNSVLRCAQIISLHVDYMSRLRLSLVLLIYFGLGVAIARQAHSASLVQDAASASSKVLQDGPVEVLSTAETNFLDTFMIAHPGRNRTRIAALLRQAQVQDAVLQAISRPAEHTKIWAEYRPIFLGSRRIDQGATFMRAHRVLLQKIATKYGVAPQYIVAILGVETRYGRVTGKYRVLDALTTLAFHYPPRASFFRTQLAALLALPPQQLPAPLPDLYGSYAGAMGWSQFMPLSLQRYGIDGDGDGRIDLWNSLPDILASTAHYLAAHGWQRGQPVAMPAVLGKSTAEVPVQRSKTLYEVEALEARGYAPSAPVAAELPATLLTLQGAYGPEYWITFANFEVITQYNRSPLYAMAVTQLAEAIQRVAEVSPAALDSAS